MSSLSWVSSLCVIAACSSAPPQHTATADRDQTARPSAGDGCSRDLRCTSQRAGATCRDATGTCVCAAVERCSGVRPPDDYEPAYRWKCTPTTREDGCPGAVPPASSPCTAALTCEYPPECCGAQTTARCADGRWLHEQRAIDCPP